MSKSPHVPVLYREVIEAFDTLDEGVFIDCTLGYGGHSELVLQAHSQIRLIGIDQDQTAIDFSRERLVPYTPRVEILKGRFSTVIHGILDEVDATEVKGILADIGVSSLQLDQSERGFSFESESLDMRMDPQAQISAYDVVNHYDRVELERIMREYGELRNWRKIADVIVSRRPFTSAKALSHALKPFMPRGKKTHPATLLMQAIRIEVNDELGELERLLDALEEAALPEARIAIISFHSLEDRIVKQRFARWAKSCICPPEAMRCSCGNDHQKGRVLTKKPITAKADELHANPRSRSAKLRLFQMERK